MFFHNEEGRGRKCIHVRAYNLYRYWDRAVAPSLTGPVFAAGTKIQNTEDMHFKHTFKLGGGYWPKVKQCSESRVVLLQCCRT